MAVSSTDTYSGPYEANGVTVEFPFTFAAVDANDVGVFIRDANGADFWADPTEYTVTLTADGGHVTYAIPPTSGDVYVASEPSFLQQVDFQAGQPFLPTVVNEVNDRDVIRALYLRNALRRSPQSPIGGGAENKFPFLKPDGTWGWSDGTGADAGLRMDLAGPSGGGLVAAVRSAIGAVTRWVSDKIFETWSFEDFGAVGDAFVNADGTIGGTDDTAAIIKAVTAAATKGARIRMLGKFYRTTALVSVPDTVAILGCGANVETALPANVGVRKPRSGSWFLFDHSSIGLYNRDDSDVGNPKHFCRLRDFGTYREHAAPGVGWTPTVHAEDIRVESRVDVDDLVLLNPYIGIKVRQNGCLKIGEIRMQALYTGIELERSSDANYFGIIHDWPFWTQETSVLDYTIDNAATIRARRCDGLRAGDIFSYGKAWTIDAQDVNGDLSGFAAYKINSLYCDKAGGGVRFKSDYYPSYGSIGSIVVNSDAAVGGAGAAVEIAGATASTHQINAFAVTRAHEEALKVTGAAHLVNVQPYKIEFWNRLNASHYAFKADNGATINLLSVPAYAGSNGLLYNQGASGGIINFPVRYQIGRAIVGPTGFNSTRLSIADDGVAVIPVPQTDKTVNLHITPASAPAAGNPAGSYWLRCTGSPSASVIYASHTANVDVGTGALTGTTGTDGNLRINAHSDGNIYIENRTGAAKVYIITLLGN